ncbi:MAG: hypothetical protein OXC53_03770, partial [Rhodobacteraceae bacterium]|nr:hypothetical protein [Paracoccaceae bacterium]
GFRLAMQKVAQRLLWSALLRQVGAPIAASPASDNVSRACIFVLACSHARVAARYGGKFVNKVTLPSH